MSILNPVLYGNRLYSRETYSANQDPQTFNLMFNETISETDSIGNDVTKPLSDAMTLLDAYMTTMQLVKTDTMTLADAIALASTKSLSDSITPSDTVVKNFTKVLYDMNFLSDQTVINSTKGLSDSMTLSEAFQVSFGRSFMDAVTLADSITKTSTLAKNELVALSDTLSKNITKALAETVTSTDSKALIVSRTLSEFVNVMDQNIILTIVKGFNEILLVQDWINISIQKPQVWTLAQKPLVAYSSLYGRNLYGVTLYSGQFSTVWLSIKPTVTNNGWKNLNQLEQPS